MITSSWIEPFQKGDLFSTGLFQGFNSLAGHYRSCSMKIKKPDNVRSLIKISEILIIPSLSVTWEEGGDQVQLPVVPPPCPILDPPHPDPTQCTTLTPLPKLPNSIPTLTILSSGCRKRVYTFWVLCYICFARYKGAKWLGRTQWGGCRVTVTLECLCWDLLPFTWGGSGSVNDGDDLINILDLCVSFPKLRTFFVFFPVGPKFWKWNHTACNRRMIEEPNYRC